MPLYARVVGISTCNRIPGIAFVVFLVPQPEIRHHLSFENERTDLIICVQQRNLLEAGATTLLLLLLLLLLPLLLLLLYCCMTSTSQRTSPASSSPRQYEVKPDNTTYLQHIYIYIYIYISEDTA